MPYHEESFTPSEVEVLNRFFTNVDRPVFALINLPEVVKGALFARYSRSSKSVRRLFLDEFVNDPETGIAAIAQDPLVDEKRAESLYRRVFFEYGDDSVAQLGGVHLACEQASNILTKVLEWGRLASYLEQSTRYIAYDVPLGERYRYMVPDEIELAGLGSAYRQMMENIFDTYRGMVGTMTDYFERRFPRAEDDSKMAWTASIRAKACDTVRGLLPASTLSNVGIYGSGQAYEMALVRMAANPLAEVRDYGQLMLAELRKVIPSFLTRVDLPDRGGAWSDYLRSSREAIEVLRSDGERRGRGLRIRRSGRADRLGPRRRIEAGRRGPLRGIEPFGPRTRRLCQRAQLRATGGRDCRPFRRPEQSATQARAGSRANRLPV